MDPITLKGYQSSLLDRRVAGSHDFFFTKEETQQWLQGKSSFLSVTGYTGFGKTFVAASVIEKAKQEQSDDSFVGYCFCSQLSSLTVLRSLIWQIAQKRNCRPDQKAKVLNVYHEWTPNPRFVMPEHEEIPVFRELLIQLLQSYKQATLILDGIDQCSFPEQLVQQVFHIVDCLGSCTTSVRLFCTCQELPPISNVLRQRIDTVAITSEDVWFGAALFLQRSFESLNPGLTTNSEEEILQICLKEADQGWPYVLHRLALEYLDDRFREAGTLAQEVLEFRSRRFHEESRPVIECQRVIAVAMERSGRGIEAEEMQRRLLQLWRQKKGTLDKLTISLMNDLSLTLSNIGKGDEAATLQAEALVNAGEDPGVALSIRSNLAISYMQDGRLNIAEQIIREVVGESVETHGEDHEITMLYKGNLGQVLSRMGRRTEAEELEVAVMEMRQRTLGLDDGKTLQAMSNVGWGYQQRGRFLEARALQQEVLERRTRLLGPLHPDTIAIVGNLAWTLHNLGEYKEAKRLARIAMAAENT